jgi:hypothetical protein
MEASVALKEPGGPKYLEAVKTPTQSVLRRGPLTSNSKLSQ